MKIDDLKKKKLLRKFTSNNHNLHSFLERHSWCLAENLQS